jgi:hypothetical protein
LSLPLKFLNFANETTGIINTPDLLCNKITNKPRDSFHASLAHENKVNVFIVRDARLLKGVNKLNIKPIDISIVTI